MSARLIVFIICYVVIALIIILCPIIIMINDIVQLRKRRRVGGP